MTPQEKILQMFAALALFAVILGWSCCWPSAKSVVAQAMSRPSPSRSSIGPTILPLIVGPIYPAILTINESFQNAEQFRRRRRPTT